MPKGQTPWNKSKVVGDRLTEEGRQRIINNNIAYWQDPEWAASKRESLKGKPEQKKRGYTPGEYNGEKHWNTGRIAWNNQRTHKVCEREACEVEFDVSPSHAKRRFCSNSCQARVTNRRRLDRQHTDAGDQYGGDWPQVRQRILERDGNKCQLLCPRPGKRLEVHHLCYDAACRDEGHRRQAWPVRLGKLRQSNNEV